MDIDIDLTSPPTVILLKYLARAALRQKSAFLQAIRLWVILRVLYEEPSIKDPFTFPEWREFWFTASHPKSDRLPDNHDRTCPCSKTTQDWLLQALSPSEITLWCEQFVQQEQCSLSQIQDYLQQRPFQVTRRSLQSDFYRLRDLGWLTGRDRLYSRVSQPPLGYPISKNASPLCTLPLINPDLELTVQTLLQPLGGHPRFFLYLDYVVHQSQQDRVEDWQNLLKQIWTQTPIPPLELSYNSAKLGKICTVIIYPVSIYYVRRALYLCGFGATPQGTGEWYNYRLERIEKMTVRSWEDADIPTLLGDRHQQQTLPTPEYIETELDRVWGFDFWEPKQFLLYRFDRQFHDRYIQGTHRHATFKPISYETVRSHLQKHHCLSILKSKSPQDAYYQADYRDNDINVIQRLRAWRPFGEVLWPLSLRERMRAEVNQEQYLYQSLEESV
ncbi:TIGR03985 family CRISPR-associated protein [Roseofilum sp. BLCC_M154]|uniref:TIGR03985 family CRISPR-associated protein n=1 Tax=Roseofilum acuticapitatum BLCC-M154 TaxID=3022444 RepID=A0ABT7B134_9CYAN|nr:TIGR03985 family CRISPR-associated protein [Roseofilum acuticapitatum]MDJ1172369.1 TIGR03985 family CRISPR-associated protein [Roseofilum acuticapitatum BLCC-M154]